MANFPPEQLEACLLQLLAPDTTLISQAEQALKGYLKHAECVGGFLLQIQHSQHSQVRHMASILLKKRINTHWNKLDGSTQVAVKANLLNLAAAEPERLVRNSIVQLIACLSKHQLPSNQWPELLTYISAAASNQNVGQLGGQQ